MVNLIKRDTFILSEIDIFQIVAKWRKSNTDLDDLVLKCVRLEWISIVDLVSKIWKPKLISCDKILNAISEIVDVDPKTSKPRAQTGKSFFFCFSLFFWFCIYRANFLFFTIF